MFPCLPQTIFVDRELKITHDFFWGSFSDKPSKQGVKETYLERNSPGGIIAKEDSILEKESMLRDVRLSGCNSQFSLKVQKTHFQQFLDDPENDGEKVMPARGSFAQALKASSRNPPAQGNS